MFVYLHDYVYIVLTCTIMYIISAPRRGNREGAASDVLRFGVGG